MNNTASCSHNVCVPRSYLLHTLTNISNVKTTKYRGICRTLSSNIYDGAFLRNYLTAKILRNSKMAMRNFNLISINFVGVDQIIK